MSAPVTQLLYSCAGAVLCVAVLGTTDMVSGPRNKRTLRPCLGMQRCLGAVSEVDADETSTVDSSGSDVEKEARTVSQGLSRPLPQSLASSSSRQEIDVQSWSIVGRKAPVVQRAVESVEAG